MKIKVTIKAKPSPMDFDFDKFSRLSFFILDENHNPVEEPDLIKWGEWMASSNRQVGYAEFQGKFNEDIVVSTIFLAIPTFPDFFHKPRLFETMIAGGKHDGEVFKYLTWIEAKESHTILVEQIKKGL
jgi:hypothetical protein